MLQVENIVLANESKIADSQLFLFQGTIVNNLNITKVHVSKSELFDNHGDSRFFEFSGELNGDLILDDIKMEGSTIDTFKFIEYSSNAKNLLLNNFRLIETGSIGSSPFMLFEQRD